MKILHETNWNLQGENRYGTFRERLRVMEC